MSLKRNYIFLISALLLLIVTGFVLVLNKDSFTFGKQILLLDSHDPSWQSNSQINKNIAGVTTSDVFTGQTEWCSVDLNQKILEPEGLRVGDYLKINLCAGINYTAKIDKISKNVNDTTTIRGRIIDSPMSYIIINSTGDRSFIEIEVPEEQQHFIIQAGIGQDYLIDRSDIVLDGLEDKPVLTPPEDTGAPVAPAGVVNDDTTVDVMVVYTSAARVWADSYSTGINNVIAQSMASGQLVNDNSNTDLTFRLVHSFETDYTESGNSNTDLIRITNIADGYMDNVHTFRDQYGADLVVLLAKVNDAGGVGWLLNNEAGLPDYAFSLTRVQQAQWTYTVVHELGHNMGAHHSKLQNFQPGPGLYSYSAGWRWVGADSGKYCSVMTYQSGVYFPDGQTHSRVAYWSNPDVTYQSVATGDALDGDNAHNVRNTKSVVSQYRNTVDYPTISISSPSSTSTVSGPITYAITYSGANNVTLASQDITLNRTGNANGSVSVSGSGNASRTVTISDITGAGTLGISISAGTATNIENNSAPAVGPSTTFIVGSSGGGGGGGERVISTIIHLSPTNFSKGWNMSSFPDLSAGVTSNTLFPNAYKIRKYDAANNSYIKGENSNITLTPGAGYWIKIDDVNEISGRSYNSNQVSSTEIPVNYGWNLLGSPYQTNIPLSNLSVKYKDGTNQTYEEAVNSKNVAGYVWNWNGSIKRYVFITIYLDRYGTDAPKKDYISPYEGFWLLAFSHDISSIILNR